MTNDNKYNLNYFHHLFATMEMKKLFSDHGRVTAWLDVEAALARAEASCGLIPETAATEITQSAQFENLDMTDMRAEYEHIGFPILPLVHQMAKICDPEAAKFVHWGATTQDIVDTGLVLQMRKGLEFIERDLDAIIDCLANLCERHRNTAMAGRTFQQKAAPITFGFKVAVWLDELLRHRERLPGVKKRALVCQFGGAVGTLATLGDQGLSVLKKLSEELDLEEPAISWHTARDGWAELIFWLSMICQTFSKIANEVANLMRSEVDELREPYEAGRGGSSTMPQKRNPVACPPIIAIGCRMREVVPSQLTAMIQEHERDVATQPLEWLVIPEAFVLSGASTRQTRDLIKGLYVNESAMTANLEAGGGLLMAEAVMMGLAPRMGRGAAHDLVKQVSEKAINEGLTLREALFANVDITDMLDSKEIDNLLDPLAYTGVASGMIDRVLAKV
jgi:3-carboxy-cis,cis-muconate cycloisomerase